MKARRLPVIDCASPTLRYSVGYLDGALPEDPNPDRGFAGHYLLDEGFLTRHEKAYRAGYAAGVESRSRGRGNAELRKHKLIVRKCKSEVTRAARTPSLVQLLLVQGGRGREPCSGCDPLSFGWSMARRSETTSTSTSRWGATRGCGGARGTSLGARSGWRSIFVPRTARPRRSTS